MPCFVWSYDLYQLNIYSWLWLYTRILIMYAWAFSAKSINILPWEKMDLVFRIRLFCLKRIRTFSTTRFDQNIRIRNSVVAGLFIRHLFIKVHIDTALFFCLPFLRVYRLHIVRIEKKYSISYFRIVSLLFIMFLAFFVSFFF